MTFISWSSLSLSKNGYVSIWWTSVNTCSLDLALPCVFFYVLVNVACCILASFLCILNGPNTPCSNSELDGLIKDWAIVDVSWCLTIDDGVRTMMSALSLPDWMQPMNFMRNDSDCPWSFAWQDTGAWSATSADDGSGTHLKTSWWNLLLDWSTAGLPDVFGQSPMDVMAEHFCMMSF